MNMIEYVYRLPCVSSVQYVQCHFESPNARSWCCTAALYRSWCAVAATNQLRWRRQVWPERQSARSHIKMGLKMNLDDHWIMSLNCWNYIQSRTNLSKVHLTTGTVPATLELSLQTGVKESQLLQTATLQGQLGVPLASRGLGAKPRGGHSADMFETILMFTIGLAIWRSLMFWSTLVILCHSLDLACFISCSSLARSEEPLVHPQRSQSVEDPPLGDVIEKPTVALSWWN